MASFRVATEEDVRALVTLSQELVHAPCSIGLPSGGLDATDVAAQLALPSSDSLHVLALLGADIVGFARLVTLDPSAAGDHIPPAAVAAAVAPAHVRLHQFGVLPRVAGDHAVARSLIVEACRHAGGTLEGCSVWTSVPADDASSLAFLPSCGFSLCGPSLPPGAGSGPVLLVAPLPLPLPALPTGGEGASTGPPRFALVLHGGAGTIERRRMTPEMDSAYRGALQAALDAGLAVLGDGKGSALDAVCAVVCSLEDSPLFNAGRGSVFTDAGECEMEASVMCGHSRACGAATGVRKTQNPVLVARAVMEHTQHTMLAYPASDALAVTQGLPQVDPSFFHTDRRRAALKAELERRVAPSAPPASAEATHGTVGCVALDAQGRMACATSTGGRTGKMPGRVGDTPCIGAGSFADAACAVSGTGHGETFLRFAAAHEISARVRMLGQSLASACEHVVMDMDAVHAGSGGVIAVDAQGGIAMSMNCEGMYRAWRAVDGTSGVAIYADE